MSINVQKGFTLIEMVIVISVIGFLMVLGFNSYGDIQKANRDARRKTDIQVLRSALEMYRGNKGSYPGKKNTLVESGYIKVWPKDPKGVEYSYTPSCSSNICRSYTISIPLEKNNKTYEIDSDGVEKLK